MQAISQSINKIVRSVGHAVRGVKAAYRYDESFTLEINWGLPAYLLLGWLLWPMPSFEILFFVGSYLNILRTELLNTSIEFVLNHLHPENHDNIKRAKDTASGAVLVAFMMATIVLAVLLLRRFGWGV
jgi:diacylglycerol kinase (ATP)